MKMDQILNEAVTGDLVYHGVNYPDRAITQLKSNKILGYTTQRFWPDGTFKKDNDPDYETSWLLKGISTTRDFDFAKKWGNVVYILDKALIKQNYKVVPINWGNTIGALKNQNYKKEKEEFIILNVLRKSFDDLKKEWHEWVEDREERMLDKGEEVEEFVDLFSYMFQPKGELKPLSKFLVGFMVDDFVMKFDDWDENIQFLMDHPKFKGFYSK